jgi:hypothetical protein
MLRRLWRVLIIVSPITILLLSNSSTLALGIGVAPGKMVFDIQPGGTEVQTLHVINQSGQESEFQVYAEGEKAEWVEISPAEFLLDAQEIKSVEILIAPPLMEEPKAHDFSICVVSIPSDSDLRIGAGVKVPVHVQITEFPVMAIQWWIVSAIIVVVVAIGMIVWWRRKAKHA